MVTLRARGRCSSERARRRAAAWIARYVAGAGNREWNALRDVQVAFPGQCEVRRIVDCLRVSHKVSHYSHTRLSPPAGHHSIGLVYVDI